MSKKIIVIIIAIFIICGVIIITSKKPDTMKVYDYTILEESDYTVQKLLIFLQLLLEDQTAITYGIPTFAPSNTIGKVNYSNLLIPITSKITCTGESIIWNNTQYKISTCKNHFTSLMDKNGTVFKANYHTITYQDGYIIGGNGAYRGIFDQYSNEIPDSRTDYERRVIFGLTIINWGCACPDYENPGKFRIVSDGYNKWFDSIDAQN